MILRPYQKQLKAAIYNGWNAGKKNMLAVLATGGGKSVIVSDIILDGSQIGMTQAVIAHRNELVSQMSSHLARRGIYHRLIVPPGVIAEVSRLHREEFNGRSFINMSSRTAVVGVDTLVSRQVKLKSWAAQVDRWVIDEAHHITRENKWGTAVSMFPNAQGLGVTATPARADGQGLGKNYDGVADEMVTGISMRELIETGSLADYEIVCPKSDLEISDADIGNSGDYSKQKLKAAAQKSHIVGDVVTAYIKYAAGRRAICFATDIETSGKIANDFNSHKIRAVSLSSKTPSAVRNKYVREFKEGKINILVNVDLFDEGFDTPGCDCVIMARPTASLVKYMQMFGRALRPAPGKNHGLIIDHVSNVIRHNLPDKPRIWSLARRDKRGKQEKDPDDIPLTVCRSELCAKPYERFRTCCPYCGFVPPLPEPRLRNIEMVEGDLILLDRATLDKLRASTVLESPADIGERVTAVAGNIAGRGVMNKQIEKITAQNVLKDTIAQWAAIERLKGFNDSEIHRKFYFITGCDILTALSAGRSRGDYEELTKHIEGWYMK